MSSLKKDVFGINGMLHRAFGDSYEVREQQVNMSVDVANAILNRNILFAEGATGVGKSFAYLVATVSPTIRELLRELECSGPIVISTSTKVLQDQITGKDVPAILEATGQILEVLLVKGRNNYVSLRRMNEFIKDVKDMKIEFSTKETAEVAARITPKLEDWAERSSGELSTFDEPIPVEIKQSIESTNNDCQGESCKYYGSCVYYKAKQARQHADILIVNHALLASHLAYPNVLPEECSTFIIDEAHKFYGAVSGVFEQAINLRQIQWFIKQYGTSLKRLYELVRDCSPSHREILTDVLNKYASNRRDTERTAIEFFERASREVYTIAKQGSVSEVSAKYSYSAMTPALDADNLIDDLDQYIEYCEYISQQLDISLTNKTTEEEIRLSQLCESATEVQSRLTKIIECHDLNKWCYWSDVAMADNDREDSPYRLTLKRTPIDIAEQIVTLFSENNAVIFTSATLQVSNSFERVKQQLGLDTTERRVVERIYSSPFPYQDNVEIHLFDGVIMDRPTPYALLEEKEAYLNQQSMLVDEYIRMHDGRALILCASAQMLRELTDRLEPMLENLDITVLKQYGTDRLRHTFNEFKENERSVLFGLASCWEGLDASGDTLKTVIIPQLPFAPPHPLAEARKQLLDNPEQQWFWEIALPDMLLQLKQGAGRLVRSMTDKGVITILSPRPLTKRYRNHIKQALPPGKIVCNPTGVIERTKQRKRNSGRT